MNKTKLIAASISIAAVLAFSGCTTNNMSMNDSSKTLVGTYTNIATKNYSDA